MKLFIVVLMLGYICDADPSLQEQNSTKNRIPALTKSQKRKWVIAKTKAAKEEESRRLEEEGFCACSVQIP